MDLQKEFNDLLTDALNESGASLAETKENVAAYMAERTLHLSTIAREPGFGRAVLAERNNVAMKAGLSIAAEAAATDGRLVTMIGGALRLAAISMM